jgi:NAD(P)H dehydrogenase (quinone)
MTDFSNSTIAVTGAAGHLGRAVIGYLKARGARHIVAVTRDVAKLSGADGIEVRHGDFDDAASLDAAFKGVDRLLVISTDTLGASRSRQHIAAIDAAERVGVSYIAYTSITSPYPSDTALVANDHFWTEARLSQFKGDWTALRNDIYFDMIDVERAIGSGQIVHAAGDGRKAQISRDDCAAAAAGALLTATGRTIEDIAGPELLSQQDIAAAIAEATGKPVAAISVSGDELIAGMIQHGVPPNLAAAFAAFDTDAARGLYGIVSDAVERLSGRKPQSLRAFLAANRIARAA